MLCSVTASRACNFSYDLLATVRCLHLLSSAAFTLGTPVNESIMAQILEQQPELCTPWTMHLSGCCPQFRTKSSYWCIQPQIWQAQSYLIMSVMVNFPLERDGIPPASPSGAETETDLASVSKIIFIFMSPAFTHNHPSLLQSFFGDIPRNILKNN